MKNAFCDKRIFLWFMNRDNHYVNPFLNWLVNPAPASRVTLQRLGVVIQRSARPTRAHEAPRSRLGHCVWDRTAAAIVYCATTPLSGLSNRARLNDGVLLVLWVVLAALMLPIGFGAASIVCSLALALLTLSLCVLEAVATPEVDDSEEGRTILHLAFLTSRTTVWHYLHAVCV